MLQSTYDHNQILNGLNDSEQYSLIKSKFPFPEMRDGQYECIKYIIEKFDSGCGYVILEAPTGAGKSAIGECVSRFYDSSYYLTVQKILQTQIMSDFGSADVVDLKGRATYPCTYYDQFGDNLVKIKAMKQSELDKAKSNPLSCDEGYCRKKLKKFKCDICISGDSLKGTCPYYNRVYEAMRARMAVMNFSGFLYQTSMTNDRFNHRDLLIIDEAHNLEPKLLDFISFSVNDLVLQAHGLTIQKFDLPEQYWMFFVENELGKKIGRLIELAREADDIKLMDEYSRIYVKYLKFIRAMEDSDEWVCEFEDLGNYRKVTLKPIFVSKWAHRNVFDFGVKILMMSATILDADVFCRSLGLKRDSVAAYRMKNRFAVENRPIFMRSAGRIVGGKAKMGTWGPKIVSRIDDILDEYADTKGIIHTHNFAIANLIIDKCKQKDRFLYQKNYRTKEEMLAAHGERLNSIIVAPAMHEGLDLVGDLSRLQIICKMPWPNIFEDKQLAKRIDIDRRYVIWLVAIKLIQSYGRSIRHDKDWADTYVLDETFHKFINDAHSMIPGWFRDAIDYGKLSQPIHGPSK